MSVSDDLAIGVPGGEMSPALRQRYVHWRVRIFLITWLAYVGFYLTRKSFSVAKGSMESELGLTSDQLAWIDFGYLVSYALGQFVFGMVGDRLGTRTVVATGLLLSPIIGIMMGASSLAITLTVLFTLQGICQATGWAPLTKNVTEFFSQRERGVVMGAWCTNYAVGGLIASALAGAVGDAYGWRYAFYIPAVCLLVICGLFLIFQRNRPEDLGLPGVERFKGEPELLADAHDRPEEEKDGSWLVIFAVLRNPMVLLLAFTYFFLKPTRYAILFWGPKFIQERLGSGMSESALLTALFEIAGPISILLAGWMSDRWFQSKRIPIPVMCLFLLVIPLGLMNRLPAEPWILGTGFFLVGLLLFAPDAMISGIAAVDFGTKKGASTSSGVVNFAGSLGAVLGGSLPGFLKGRYGWDSVFFLLAGSIFLAALLLLPRWNALPNVAPPAKASRKNGADPEIA